MVDAPIPDLAERVERYLAVWDTFGTAEFTREEFEDATSVRGDGADDGATRESLDVLVAGGLFDWLGEDRYRVRVAPDEPLEDWLEETAARTSVLYDAVQSATAPADPTGDSQDDSVEFEGRTYQRTAVTPEQTVEEVAADLAALTDHRGVVLTAPGDEAAHVQQVADRLCTPDAVADRDDWPRFEKVTSEVLGTDPDHLEYRLYLTRRDADDR